MKKRVLLRNMPLRQKRILKAVIFSFFWMLILCNDRSASDDDTKFNQDLSAYCREAMDNHELQKVIEFKRYQPENAAADAAHDIKNDTIKLFFLDVEEVPELIAIDAIAEKLPNAKSVSIGVGCTDPIHGDNCPQAYRLAMENALTYAMRYNRAIAEAFNLKQKSEPDFLPCDTLDFLGFPDDWKAVRMELRDVQPLFGGRDILLTGTGNIFVRTVRPGAKGLAEKIHRLPQDPEARRRILHACILHDIIGLHFPPDTTPPDHGRPEIILINARGRQFALRGWDPPLPGMDPLIVTRFNAVYREFLRLERVSEETPVEIQPSDKSDSAWEKIRSREDL
ncbi:MAG: hypothetical protein V2B19_05255 [Pseudomonadota bacterium]